MKSLFAEVTAETIPRMAKGFVLQTSEAYSAPASHNQIYAQIYNIKIPETQ